MAGAPPEPTGWSRRGFAEALGCACAAVAVTGARGSRGAEIRVITTDMGEYGKEVVHSLQGRFPNLVQGDDGPALTRRTGPARYVSIGPTALSAALRAAIRDPLLALLVSAPTFARILASDSDRPRPPRLTAIFAEASPEAQFELIAALFKRAVQVGVMLADESAALEQRLRTAARRYGMELRVHRLAADANPIRETNRLADAAVVLGVPDSGIFNNHTFAALLETTYGRGQGVVGFSRAMVRAGTVASAYASAEDVAEHAAEVLSVNDDDRLPHPQYPRYWRVEVNRRVAVSLNLSVDESVLELGVRPKARTR